MNQAMKRTMYILVVGAVLLAACAAPAAAPTQDPAEAQKQIQEAVALTVAAQNAQATEQQSLLPAPTNTTLPTQTEAAPAATDIPLPTATPFVVVPPTTVPVAGGSSGTTVKPEYSCDVIRQRPIDNSYWKRNKDFDVRWTIVNTGTKSWQAGLDLKYSSGPNFTNATMVELPAMAPGDQYEVILDAVTPSQDGYYVMVWKLEGGFCYPYVAINVEQ